MPVTVQCETCGSSVTVGDEMRGLSAPCSHCQRQLAIPDPEAVVDGAAGSSSPSSSLSHTGQPSSGSLNFDVFPTEADSIFVTPEAASEDLFGRAEVFDPNSPPASGNPLPDAPALVAAPENAGPPTTVTASSAPVTETPASSVVAMPPPEPAASVAEVAPPWLSDDYAGTVPVATPEAVAGGDSPWRDEGEALAAAASFGTDEEAGQTFVGQQAAAPRVVARPKAKIPASFWMLSFLLPYALAVSVFAAMMFARTPPRSQHPLESLIDQGVYEEGRQQFIENPKRELPSDLKPLKLNETRTIGDLEITPLEVLHQRVRYRYKEGVRDRLSDEEMLVLRLRLKNASHPPIIFHPNDPTFVRGEANAYSYLEVGARRFYSPIGNLQTERIEGQNFDELLPDASMETIVVASQEISGSPENLLAVLKKLSPSETLLWRVQLRKGQERVEAKGKSKLIWATTVVPVAFSVSDVKEGAVATPNLDEKRDSKGKQ